MYFSHKIPKPILLKPLTNNKNNIIDNSVIPLSKSKGLLGRKDD